MHTVTAVSPSKRTERTETMRAAVS